MRIVLLSILFFAPAAFGSCAPKEILSRILKLHPDDIRWNRDLRSLCQVTDQGSIPTCGIHGATGVVEQYLKKLGELKPSQRISVEYYESIYLKEAIEKLVAKNEKISPELLNGLSPTESYHYVISKGVVTDPFSFPKLKVKDAKGNVAQRSVLEDEEVRDLVLETLESARHDPEKLKALMTRYLGDTDAISRKEIKPEFRQSLVPAVYTTTRFQKYIPYVPKRVISPNFERIEKAIRRSIDAKVPVTVSSFENSAIHAANESATTFANHPPLKEVPNMGHTMKIIGYHLNSSGRIDWYLVQNSWGPNWGAKGTFSMSSDYAEHHGLLFHIYDEHQLSW